MRRIFRGDIYQSALILTGVAATVLFGLFLYRELFPEYKIYQNDYIELEKFRATYSGQLIPPFTPGIKQIVMEKENKGPADIDRCISCHVALQFEHFSPTKLVLDVNGSIRFDEKGIPLKTENENYVFLKLNQKIKELEESGNKDEAEKLASLKTAHVGKHVYDVTQVLKMHPLIGKEIRPFQNHPIEEYGCTVCHNGNGRGLTTEKAHGPIFDGDYETEFMGHKQDFLEIDEVNDPLFSKVFNNKPGHELLFMTTPLYVGGLIEAKCIQCHKPSDESINYSANTLRSSLKATLDKGDAIKRTFADDLQAFTSLKLMQKILKDKSFESAIKELQERENDLSLSDKEREEISQNYLNLVKFKTKEQALEHIQKELFVLSEKNEELIAKTLQKDPSNAVNTLIKELAKDQDPRGSLAIKAKAYNLQQDLAKHVLESNGPLNLDTSTISSMKSDIDQLTSTYQMGKALYIAEGCYACHRMAGVSRAGVGPELTKEGLKYPWFVKESIVWPQADLKTSTMPNMHLDHEEVEALTTFLLAQTGKRKSDSDTGYKIQIQEWESGKKNAWENPVPPSKLNDLQYSMTVFATEGCAACHRLKGFESDVGFAIEKKDPSFLTLFDEREWFTKLFPEEIPGSEIVKIIDKHSTIIDQKIVDGVRTSSLIEKIEREHPGIIDGYYSNFKYAMRAKNHDPKKEEWQARVKRVLMIYIQEYGLGRLIGPKPNWSGVFRSDEWLMEHFRNPSALIARSIMPVFPFDDTKFYALTKMLDTLGIRNSNDLKEIWNEFGFNPERAYTLLCAQCHGDHLQGNGPISKWIYPVPKNLRNANFLRNLTKERAFESIMHGVMGTPMPPWGEIGEGKKESVKEPVLTMDEIDQLVDWLYSSLPGSTVIRNLEDVPKWHYTPQDALDDLRKEDIEKLKNDALQNKHAKRIDLTREILYASLTPSVDEFFDVTKNPNHSVDKTSYRIKQIFYTKENLESGQRNFELNCAVCHGKDADGRGLRAEMMVDAKPRMLTNLNWLNTRDDLRLLRSIKFGVPGTSMTPWGDVTSGLQRMQLVMYIRTLSAEGMLKEKLTETIYQTFDPRIQTLETARSYLSSYLDKSLANKKALLKKQNTLKSEKEINAEELALNIEDMIKAQKEIEGYTELDNKILDLITTIKHEKLEFQNTGYTLIGMLGNSKEFDAYIAILSKLLNPLAFDDGKLILQEKKGENTEDVTILIDGLQNNVTAIKKELDELKKQPKTEDIDERLSELNSRKSQFEKLIKKITYLLKLREKNFQIEQQDIMVFNDASFR